MKLQEYPLKMGFITFVLWLNVFNLEHPYSRFGKNYLFLESYYFYILVVIVEFLGVGLCTSIINTI